MKLSQKVSILCVLLSVFLSLSSCDLFGFGKESLLEPMAFTPFAIESDWFAVDTWNGNTIYVIDVANDRVAGTIHFKCTRGWGVPTNPRVIKDRVYVCSSGVPCNNPPKEAWSITPSTGASRRIALPSALEHDFSYLPKANKVIVNYASRLTLIDYDTDSIAQNCPTADSFDSIFEASDGTIYGVAGYGSNPTFSKITLDPFTVTGLTPANGCADPRLRGHSALELPSGKIAINNGNATIPQITLYSPEEGKIVKTLELTYDGVTFQYNNKYPFCLQMYNNGNVLLVGHGLWQEDLWEAAISIHDPETLEIKGWITGEYITPSFYVRRDKLYCVDDSQIYVRDLKTNGYPLIKTIELK